jgi:hypothetical protein
MDELQYDSYTTVAKLYDTQDLTIPWDWRGHHQDTMPSSNAQRIGAIAETRFVAECLERDFEPHTPTTPMPWDFIVHCPAGDLKVQVKSTSTKIRNHYMVNTGTGTSTKEHMSDIIDVVAIYVAPIKQWWMMPRDVVTSKTLKLYPENPSKSKYKKYQNNWSIYYK